MASRVKENPVSNRKNKDVEESVFVVKGRGGVSTCVRYQTGPTDIPIASLQLYTDIDINKKTQKCVCGSVCVHCGHVLRQQRTTVSYLR